MRNRAPYPGKYLLDAVFGTLGLIALSPVLLTIAVVIKATSKGPVFFLQKRVGRYGKPFQIYKFRTMEPNAEEMGLKITVGEDPRVTQVGRFLRRYKLDETPQIINIVKGDMSFVGPRPEVPQYVDLYSKKERQVLSIRPGVTDLASIRYRRENEVLAHAQNPEKTYIEEIMPAKLAINLEYVANASFRYDAQLILKTIRAVFFNRS
ncbi:Lipid carrier : UDP-N-acetylgalactosaminyltransferase [Clostridiaceae bacterium JG1575]|nr:Lipid carrier : UDP-N-acetylgalactosaminyltransferase [Clostridiaceae bacterium JG1575]